MKRTDIQADVVSRILEALESGELFWRKPWTIHANAGPLAISLSSKKPYRGINQLLLMLCRWQNDYDSKWSGTFQQIKAKGGSVLKGEKATRVILFKPVTKETTNENGEQEKSSFALMKSFAVFNADQTTLTDYQVDEPVDSDNVVERHETAEALIAGTGCVFNTGHSAHYNPSSDEITLPPRHRFESPEAFYETAFHELAHWAEKRTNFDRSQSQNSYGFGELVAELTAVSVMATLQLETQASTENSAAYLQNWIRTIREDHTVIFKAASQAAKATEFLMSFAPQDNSSLAVEQTPAMVTS